jgi:hypothetical protein
MRLHEETIGARGEGRLGEDRDVSMAGPLITDSASFQSLQRNGALGISKAGTMELSVGIEGEDMSNAPDFNCWSKSTSLPNCSDGKTRTTNCPPDFFVTLSANSL